MQPAKGAASAFRSRTLELRLHKRLPFTLFGSGSESFILWTATWCHFQREGKVLTPFVRYSVEFLHFSDWNKLQPGQGFLGDQFCPAFSERS